MKFLTAKRELARLAKAEYYGLKYELIVQSGEPRRLVPECWVYIHGYCWHRAPTWSEALAALRAAMQLPRSIDEGECPIEPVAERTLRSSRKQQLTRQG